MACEGEALFEVPSVKLEYFVFKGTHVTFLANIKMGGLYMEYFKI